MATLYITETDKSLNQGTVTSGETLHEGEFIKRESGGTERRFDPANDVAPDGIIVHDPAGDAIAQHDEDYFASYDNLWTYGAGENFYYQPLDQGDNIQPRTLSDNGTDPAPSFDEGDVVGIVTINTQTQLVQSGYTDNGGTTYSEAGAGNFIAIGKVDKVPQEVTTGLQTWFDQRLPIELTVEEFGDS